MTELLCEFTVYGDPKPKGRPRFANGRAYTDRKTQDAESRVLEAFHAECPLWEPTIETLRVEIDFHRATFRSADVDNLAKTVMDALNGVCYRDDKQIAQLELNRVYGAGDEARTVVRVWILEGD